MLNSLCCTAGPHRTGPEGNHSERGEETTGPGPSKTRRESDPLEKSVVPQPQPADSEV